MRPRKQHPHTPAYIRQNWIRIPLGKAAAAWQNEEVQGEATSGKAKDAEQGISESSFLCV